MALNFCSFASGSKGNCYLVKSESTTILVDAGISCKRIMESLQEMEICAGDVAGVLVTHEHSDHIRGLKVATKKNPSWKVYINNKAEAEIAPAVTSENMLETNSDSIFTIGDIKIRQIPLSHDAKAPVGYSFISDKKQITIITDTGYVSSGIQQELTDADILVIEANHDVNMLKMGRYPWMLKQRILGYEGHLSNEAAGEAIVRALNENEKPRCVVLAHLSAENNFPRLAYQTVKNILEENDYYLGKHVSLNIAGRDKISDMFQI